jgi:NAD dependent epimerase/dehydratase
MSKKVLVTGADGFIGSHLTEALVKEGYHVRALSYYNSFNHWGWLEDVDCKNEIEVVTGDIRDPHFCRKLVEGTEMIFHLAALIAIPFSYVAPDMYVDTNIRGTLNICQAALDHKVKRLIHTSTSEVYGTACYVPIDEKHPLQPQSPYSATKIGADAIAMSFFNAFELPVTIARPFNTYGPRQSARAVIPNIISQIAANEKKIKAGDLTPTRDFNFVKDTCEGFIQLSKYPAAIGETINIGSGKEISIGDVAKLIKTLMKSDVEIIQEKQRIRPEKSEVFRLLCDNTKIKELTGYEPKYSLDDGLQETISWFTDPENLKKYKTGIYNV